MNAMTDAKTTLTDLRTMYLPVSEPRRTRNPSLKSTFGAARGIVTHRLHWDHGY